ncbi:MAG: WD40 repeat domain-containing protein [Acidobacteriota bacterium]
MFDRLRLTSALPMIALTTAVAAAPSFAAEVAIFRQDSRATALEGDVDGTSVGADGELRLAPVFERLGGLDEPFLFSAAAHPAGGAILGTGNDGKVFQIDPDGAAEMVGRVPEPSVFAVHATAEGDLYAAGSPNGKVMRLVADGEAEEVFDPEATYVWDLAEDAEGRLLVATGLPGRVYRLSGGESELLYESSDRHVRALLPQPDGSLVLGTAGQGLIVRLAADGTAETLYDAAEPEVLGFAQIGDVLYAALLASEASQVDLSSVSGGDGETSGQDTIGSRASGYEGPRSRVLALTSNRTPRSVAELSDETIHTIAAYRDRLWIGTGQEGGLYRLERDELTLETTFDERQLIAVMPSAGGDGLLAATTDSVALHRWGGERRESGTFTSRVLDAAHAARFGVLRWWGEGGSDSVSFAVRVGMAEKPDATWTDWRTLGAVAGGGRDRSLGPDIGVARYLQWRATLRAGDQLPEINAVELSYRQLNQAPKLGDVEVLDAGKILVSQSFNPTSTTFEPWSPNRDGIFTRLRAERNDGQMKTLWKRGYRTLKFEAEDPNGDTLTYKLEVKAQDGDKWLPVAEDLDEAWFSFDATVLPDGEYRFRVTAADARSNPHGDALEDTKRSDLVLIDHTPPSLESAAPRSNGSQEVVVADALHPIRHAAVSVDAGPWKPVESLDGLLDSRREKLRLEAPDDAGLVLLRVTDAALNVVTLAVESR